MQTLEGFQGGMVRKEYGAKNGALHYHLILLGLPKLDIKELRRRWSHALRYKPAPGQPEYLRVDVQKAEHSERVCKYLCKYVSKAAWEGAQRDTSKPGEAAPGAEGTPDRGRNRATGQASDQEPEALTLASITSKHLQAAMDRRPRKFAAEFWEPAAAGSAIHLSKAQIPTGAEEMPANIGDSESLDGFTGTRFWSFFGDWPFSEEQSFTVGDLRGEFSDVSARSFAARVRRIFRKWRVAVERKSFFDQMAQKCSMGGDARPLSEIPECFREGFRRAIDREADKHKAQFRRKKLRWCKGAGGFVLFLSPDMIEQCINNAYQRDIFIHQQQGKVAAWI